MQLAARDRGLYRAVTDCGAGGLSSAVGEMGETCGAHVVLDDVPLKYHGLSYPEIWISEAQERMVFAVPPEHVDELLALCASEDVDARVIGTFDGTMRLTAEFHETQVMDLPMKFLHDGLPRQKRTAVRRQRTLADPPELAEGAYGGMLLEILASPNVASKSWIIRQYDHEVQAGSVIKPLVGPRRNGPGDAAVVAPVLGSSRAFAVGCGLNPLLGDVDPYQMALHAIDEAMRNVVCVGGDPDQTSLLDNFSWGNCEKPENLGDLVEACLACYDGAMAYRTPFISGKDSLNNDYRVGDESRSIPPTLLISALSIVPELSVAVSMDLKAEGHDLVLVGLTGPELGGSHLAHLQGVTGAKVPPLDLHLAPRLLEALHEALRAGLIASCHDLSEGGLAVAAAEMAFAGEVGADIDVARVPVRDEAPTTARLFGESPSRLLLEVVPQHHDALNAILGDVPHATIGKTVNASRVRITNEHSVLLETPLDALRQAHLGTLDLDGEYSAP